MTTAWTLGVAVTEAMYLSSLLGSRCSSINNTVASYKNRPGSGVVGQIQKFKDIAIMCSSDVKPLFKLRGKIFSTLS